mgnify:FL=1
MFRSPNDWLVSRHVKLTYEMTELCYTSAPSCMKSYSLQLMVIIGRLVSQCIHLCVNIKADTQLYTPPITMVGSN